MDKIGLCNFSLHGLNKLMKNIDLLQNKRLHYKMKLYLVVKRQKDYNNSQYSGYILSLGGNYHGM